MQAYSRNLQQLRLRLDEDLKQSKASLAVSIDPQQHKVPVAVSTHLPLSFLADTGSTPAGPGDSDSSKGGASRQTTQSATGSVSIAPRGKTPGATDSLIAACAPSITTINALAEDDGPLTFRGGCSVVSSASGGAMCGGVGPAGEPEQSQVLGVRDADSGLIYSSRHIYAPIGEYSGTNVASLVNEAMARSPLIRQNSSGGCLQAHQQLAQSAATLPPMGDRCMGTTPEAASAATAFNGLPPPRSACLLPTSTQSTGHGSRGSSCSVPAPFRISNGGSVSVQIGGSVQVHGPRPQSPSNGGRASTPSLVVRHGSERLDVANGRAARVVPPRSPSPAVTRVRTPTAGAGAATSPVPPAPRALRFPGCGIAASPGNVSPPIPLPRAVLGQSHSPHRLAAPAPLPLASPAFAVNPRACGTHGSPIPVWRAPDWPSTTPPQGDTGKNPTGGPAQQPLTVARPGYLSPPQSYRSATPPVPTFAAASPPPLATTPAAALLPGTPATDPDFLRRSLHHRAGGSQSAGEGSAAGTAACTLATEASVSNLQAGLGADTSTAVSHPMLLMTHPKPGSMPGSPGSPPPLPPPPPTPPLAAPWEPWAGAQDLALGGPGQPWAAVRGRCSSSSQKTESSPCAPPPPCAAWGPRSGFASPLTPIHGVTHTAPGVGSCGGAGGSLKFPVSNVGPCIGVAGCTGPSNVASLGGAPYPCSPPLGTRSVSPMPVSGGCSPQRSRVTSINRAQDSYVATGWGSVVASPPLQSCGPSCPAAVRAPEACSWVPLVDQPDTSTCRGVQYAPSSVGYLQGSLEHAGSLPPTQLNLHYQEDGIINSGPLAMDVDFTRLCSPAPMHQRGASESPGGPYPESFDYSEPTWLQAPFGVQHQVSN